MGSSPRGLCSTLRARNIVEAPRVVYDQTVTRKLISPGAPGCTPPSVRRMLVARAAETPFARVVVHADERVTLRRCRRAAAHGGGRDHADCRAAFTRGGRARGRTARRLPRQGRHPPRREGGPRRAEGR